MTKARKEGATAPAKAEPVNEGAKHAAALLAAIEYYNANAALHAEECKNWPFGVTVANVVNQLKVI
jgi:hypothetical protein